MKGWDEGRQKEHDNKMNARKRERFPKNSYGGVQFNTKSGKPIYSFEKKKKKRKQEKILLLIKCPKIT